ncbi:MAG: hypothetical protein Kow0090_06600 [Myxococcota bacterium]
MSEEQKQMGENKSKGAESELEEGFFDQDEELKSKSKLPLFVGLGAAVIIIVVLAIVFSGPSLSDEDKKVFQAASDALRTDDYKNYPDAERKLLQLAERYPNEPLVISWLAQLYLAWGDALGTETGILEPKVKEANELLTKLTEEMGKTKEGKKRQALEAAFAETKKKYDEINALYEFRRSEAAKKKNDGFEWSKRGIKAKSAHYASYRAIADYYRITRSWDKAEEQLDYVGKARPESAGLRFIKGAIAMERDKNFDKAISWFKEALEKDPKFTKAKYYIGLAQDAKGDKEGAQKTMEEILKTSPSHPGAQVYLKMTTVLDIVKKSLEEALKMSDENGAAPPEEEKKEEPEKKPPEKKTAKKKK